MIKHSEWREEWSKNLNINIISKAATEKDAHVQSVTRIMLIRMTADFSLEIMQARQQWNSTLRNFKTK
jgi:hypothetical protein